MDITRQRILVMRHPETVANVRHFLSGRVDVDLTPRGERQMWRAIDALVAWTPTRIWSSPLKRCQAIAREAADRLDVPVEVREGLAEIEFGSVQGMTAPEYEALGYRFPWELGADGRSVCAPGAESFEALYERARRLLCELRPLTGRTACVCHGGFTRAILGAIFDTPLDTFWNVEIPNVSSQLISCDERGFTLDALALAPEEVALRARSPELLTHDASRDLSGSDDQ